MKRKSHRIVPVGVLGVIVAVAAFSVQAAVNFQRETHFRCYTVSQQTPQPAESVTLSDQFIAEATVTIDEPLKFLHPNVEERRADPGGGRAPDDVCGTAGAYPGFEGVHREPVR